MGIVTVLGLSNICSSERVTYAYDTEPVKPEAAAGQGPRGAPRGTASRRETPSQPAAAIPAAAITAKVATPPTPPSRTPTLAATSPPIIRTAHPTAGMEHAITADGASGPNSSRVHPAPATNSAARMTRPNSAPTTVLGTGRGSGPATRCGESLGPRNTATPGPGSVAPSRSRTSSNCRFA